ncbi:protein ENDOPLASMIC RETICULUM-ARRESTED PEN3 [Nymphaea colorata]|uniref:protein ENDOPLASMIC RETICULUM-ARRESTED PEN3 n=1 Tax=Nymphaea colorata TaxID=210225 RepID=UPI00129D9A31|nr:protein ENDOPLASMIC RETICULUM-ARRESTED PEN3 [Nymphaea colorata]
MAALDNQRIEVPGTVKFNVGGRLFETTLPTIQSGGLESLLSVLASTTAEWPTFIDRDPGIFSILLSLLRTNHLPASFSGNFTIRELVEEASFYGIESILHSALSPPPLNGIDAAVSTVISHRMRAPPSTFAVFDDSTDDRSLLIAHAGRISAFDWSLSPAGTLRTHLDRITSLSPVRSETTAIGSTDDPGLHFYNLATRRHAGSVYWTDPTDLRVQKAWITAVSPSPAGTVFAGFESPHMENCILAVDPITLRPVAELERRSRSSARTMAPTKLRFLPESGVLMASAVSSGAFGYCGYVRILDPRVGSVVWETAEPGSGRASRYGDPLIDADADDDLRAIYKVCSKSGDVAFADLRKLGEGDPWVYLEEKNTNLRNCGSGQGSSICCYQRQVFVSRNGGELEVWSGQSKWIGSHRRNLVDKLSPEKGLIVKMAGGSNRLFVSRQGLEGVEVWESKNGSGCIRC